MALSLKLRRRQRIQPMATLRPRSEPAMRGGPDPSNPLSDDYLVEGSEQPHQPSMTLQVVQFTQVLLIALMAVLSFAVFWLLGVMFNIL